MVCQCIGFSKVILATKDTSNLNFPKDLDIKQLHDFYPVGAEKVLVSNTLGIKLTYDDIPAKQSTLVLNVQTVCAIYEAVYLNKKAASKYITIANLLKKEAQVVKVGLGSNISELADSIYPGEGLVFTEGGLMQSRRVDENDVIEKNTNFIAVSEAPRYKESPLCSKCGICVKKCPNGLEVYKIANVVDEGQISKTSRFKPQKCVSCGSCSFYCLAGRNLSQRVKEAKNFQ